ncbi:hypothetical protein LL06_17485 [Hoeflea sp. BAL378]|uniref:tudor domain-containing protein n=1 Tax=Hoeflea sp. BAL378 TaxID=1547437 RepID=UPI000512BD73|nr:tudor domain-containing protein [Hoeflea sp. BAL378]KGF68234.1 hypothetical protein LL06_17485 [Hoeflea sp. BAL378]
MNSKVILVTAGILASLVASAGAQTVGDWVLGKYQGGAYWFPGVIESIAKGTVTIRYDDGERETLGKRAVRPYDWMIGMTVECDFKGAGDWYSAKITSLAGEKIGVVYDDGSKEKTKTGRCRSS